MSLPLNHWTTEPPLSGPDLPRRAAFTYRWMLAAARMAVRTQYLVQYMIPLTRGVCPGVPLKTAVFRNRRTPRNSKAHGVPSQFDLPTMQCVNLEIRKPRRDMRRRIKYIHPTIHALCHYSNRIRCNVGHWPICRNDILFVRYEYAVWKGSYRGSWEEHGGNPLNRLITSTHLLF